MASYGKVNVLQEEPGTIKLHGGTSVPSGWSLCDGTAVSRTTFAALFNAIGTSYGAGDGSTTFNLPDFRGAAPAGAGTSVGYTENETITLGAKHNDQMQGHRHSQSTLITTPYGGTYYIGDGGGLTHMIQTANTLGPVTDGTNGTPRTGKITRGKVVGVNFIIKH